MPIPLEILDKVPLVADLPGEAKAALAQRCTLRTYRPAQEIISKENDARRHATVRSCRADRNPAADIGVSTG
jgi:signal-transduction protein with cAMP-binding, CBS, and nucleotidyltransferase domain